MRNAICVRIPSSGPGQRTTEPEPLRTLLPLVAPRRHPRRLALASAQQGIGCRAIESQATLGGVRSV